MHDRGADWELPAAEERQLIEWFQALDIDGSGSVEAEEIRALFQALGLHCTQGTINKLFASIQRNPHDELKIHDFVKMMHGGGIFNEEDNDDPYADPSTRTDSGVGKENASLMMMS